MKRKPRWFKLARRTREGWSWRNVSDWNRKCHRNVPNDCDSSWEVWGICFTRTPFSAQTNHIGKLGGRADGLRAQHRSLRRSYSSRTFQIRRRSSLLYRVEFRRLTVFFWHDPLSDILHLTDVIRGESVMKATCLIGLIETPNIIKVTNIQY